MKKHTGDLSSYRATYLECRVGMSGHNWKWDTDFKILRNPKGEIIEFSRARHCTRCTSKNVKVYDGKTGHVLRRSYDYVTVIRSTTSIPSSQGWPSWRR